MTANAAFRRMILLTLALAQPPAHAEIRESNEAIDPLSLDGEEFNRGLAARFQYDPPPPPDPINDGTAGRLSDARYFALFPDYDRSYDEGARALARILAARLIRDAESLTHEEFILRVAEIAALARNAHTSINENAFKKNTLRVPLRFYQFADGLHVLEAPPALSDLLGSRIEKIDGIAVEDIHRLLRRYHGGTDSRREAILVPFLESPALLRAAGIAGQGDAITLEGSLIDSKPFKRTVVGENRGPAAPVSSTARTIFPRLNSGTQTRLHQPSEDVPVSLEESSSLFLQRMLPGDGLYVRVDYNGDSDDQPIAEFLEGALAKIRHDKPQYVAIDLRQNGGGDYTKTYGFAKELPAAAGDAPIYVLTSPFTFSAAITTVAAIKTFGGDRVKIVGDIVGDRLDFWAEGGTFHLPNAFLDVHYSTGRHVYNGPCEDAETCFWLNKRYPVFVRTLTPDIHAPWTFDAYRDLEDPAINAVLAHERSQSSATE